MSVLIIYNSRKYCVGSVANQNDIVSQSYSIFIEFGAVEKKNNRLNLNLIRYGIRYVYISLWVFR